ncbi:MAG: hypothetical protein ACRCVU_10975 [Flavobacterium sp.]
MKFNEKYNIIKQHIYCDDNRKTLSLEETKGVKYIGTNKNAIDYTVYKVDKGLLNNMPEKQCDFVIYVPSSETVCFIELKGGNVEEGYKQLYSAIHTLVITPKIEINRVQARIVASKVRTPAIRSNHKTKLDVLLAKYKEKVITKNILLDEPIN